MLVLGCVQEIQDFELIISLPHGVSGTVKIHCISDAYTKLLEKITSGEHIDEIEVRLYLSVHFYVLGFFQYYRFVHCLVSPIKII